MPALFSSVADFQADPVANALVAFWQPLAAGVLVRKLAQASDEVNRYCKRILSTPPATSLAGSVAVGATQIAVASAVNIAEGDVVTFADGTAAEVMGADVTDWTTAPYPGTVYLVAPLAIGQTAGQQIQFYRQDHDIVIRGKSTDAFDTAVSMSQAAELAVMHHPFAVSGFSRRVDVRQYPLWSIKSAYYTLPWGTVTAEIPVDLSTATIRRSGSIKLPFGYPNWVTSMWRIAYVAGFPVIPQDVRLATHLLLANEISKALNPVGAVMIRNEGQQAHITRQSQIAGEAPPASQFVEEAQRILRDGGYRRVR